MSAKRNVNKTGPLPSGDTPASRQSYKCEAENCVHECRGDRLQEHYRKMADFDVLDTVKAMSESDAMAWIKAKLKDKEKLSHTMFLFSGGFSAEKLPTYKIHKRSKDQEEKLNPFQQCAKRTKLATQDTGKIQSESEDVTADTGQKSATSADDQEGKTESVCEQLEIDSPKESDTPEERSPEKVIPNLDGSNMSIYEQVRTALRDHENEHKSDPLSTEHMEQLAALISAKTIQLTKQSESKEESCEDNISWIDVGNMTACRVCFNYSKTEDVPNNLKASGNFGLIKKGQRNFNMTRLKKEHCQKPLHHWCLKKEQQDLKSKTVAEDLNMRAGEKVVRNALHCFKRGLGAEDFLALNDKDLGSDITNTATKNDSKAEFFKLRNVVFDLVSERTRQFFKENVNHITVTLDKVTVQRISYTVILTFFFYQGRIHIILNKLAKLSTDEYDAEGTAEMLISTLVETLGVTRSRLAVILIHFVYDGVYATKEERVSGGGCLELKKRVAELLGLDIGQITGD